MAVDLTDPTIKWATYKVSTYPAFGTQVEARNAVAIERRLELGMEGQRFFDLRRYGGATATQVMTSYLTLESGAGRRAYKVAQTPYSSPRYDLYPIPQAQIDISNVGGQQKLTQNPGW
jgi:hypothetical protein